MTEADTYRAIFQSPTLFARYILQLKLFPYQARVLECKSKRIQVVSGRQIGKTQMLGSFAIWWGITKRDQVILIIAPTLRQSKIMYDRVREMIERHEFVRAHTTHNTISFIEFDNGSKIYCLPAGLTGENIRGYPSDLTICDEAPIIKDKVMQSITPGLSAKKGTLILSGTPWGKSGFYWRVFSSDEVEGDIYRYEKFVIKSEESPLIEKAFLEAEKRTMTDAEFRMEYMAEFIDELDEYYPRKQVKECLDDYEYEPMAERRDIIIGVDPARFGSDETALIMLERLFDATLENVPNDRRLYRVIGVTTAQVTTIPDIVRMVKEAIVMYHPKRVVVDETGLGGGVVDILMEDVGGEMIEGFSFTGILRRRMYDILKVAIERRNLSLNADDSKFLRQFGGYKLRKSKSLDSRLIVSKDVLGHDDLVDGLALAIWGYEGGGRIAIIEDMAETLTGTKGESDEDFRGPKSELTEDLERIRQEQTVETEQDGNEAEFWGL